MSNVLPSAEWFLYRRVDTGGIDDSGARALNFGLTESSTERGDLGRPLFADERGNPHRVLNSFFKSATAVARSDATNWRYAHSLRVWLNFLTRRGKSWDSASEKDMTDFKFWRRSDVMNPKRISGSAWQSDVAAYLLFYRWAQQRGFGSETSPSGNHQVLWQVLSDARFSTNRVRAADVKWFTPGAYRLWRDVGILGIDDVGAEKMRWRPRSEQRDQAFCDGLYGTGLRLQEWSSVLTVELPTRDEKRRFQTAMLAGATAKGQRGRNYWIKSDVLGLIQNYLQHDRVAAIATGRDAGLYQENADSLVIERVDGDSSIAVSVGGRRAVRMSLDRLDPAARRKLLLRTPDGLEPAQIWLNQAGDARAKQGWYRTFRGVNSRVARAGIDRMVCHPHMLRHSFALFWYATGRVAWEKKLKYLNASETKDFRDQYGDVWIMVKGLLGHSDVETTKKVYLEPFQNLDTSLILEDSGDIDEVTQLMGSMLQSNPRVRGLWAR